MTLVDRLAALSSAVALGTGRLSDDVLTDLRDLDQRAGSRLRLSGEYTVVALAGATGSGKSSLFNVVAGASLAEVGVRRPTTSATQAVVFGPDGATGTTGLAGDPVPAVRRRVGCSGALWVGAARPTRP